MSDKIEVQYIPLGRTQKVRYIPSDYQPHAIPDGIKGAVYVKVGDVYQHAMGFQGKAIKPSWHYIFRDREKMEAHIAGWCDRLRSREDRKLQRSADRKAARAKGHPFKPGDIFVNSWGYDQTNVDWYQVTETTKGTVTLRCIASEPIIESDGFMCHNEKGIPGEFLENHAPIRKMVQYGTDGHAYVSMDHGSMSPWDGHPRYCSWYA